jgi:MoxR-like ATPase
LPERETELLALALQTGQNTLIVGSPGVGKSSLVTQIASIANWGVIKFSCSEETTSSKILGQWVIHDKQMVWVDGYITYAMKNGLILLEDEADFMRPELRGELHSVMEHGGTLTLSKINQETGKSFQEVIHKHPNFRWISTANTVGYGDDLFAFHGTQFFNAASRDRYEIILNIEYRTKEQEALVIISKTNIDEETCKKMVSVADSCRKESQTMTFQFSTRRLLSWANLIVTGISPTVAAKIAVLNFANKTDAHTIKSLMISHMGLEF